MKKLSFFICCLFALLLSYSSQSQSKKSEFSYLFQIVNVSKYQGKDFSLQCWIQAKDAHPGASTSLMGINYENGKIVDRVWGEKLMASDTQPGKWEKLTVSGRIGKHAKIMLFGAGYTGKAAFFYDDMKLVIKDKKGNMVIPLKNANFEDTVLTPWRFTMTPKNANISMSHTVSYHGKQSLCIDVSQTNNPESEKMADQDSPAVKNPKILLDSIITLFQTRSIYAHTADWDSIKPIVYAAIDHSKSNAAEAIIPAYIKLSDILDVSHGGLIFKGKNYGAANNYLKKAGRIPENIRTAAGNKQYRFRTEMIDNHYGYIAIPSVSVQYSNDMKKLKQAISWKTKMIQDSLCTLNRPGLKGIILDFRLNGGGSTPIMIGGISQLLKDGNVLTFVMGNGKDQKILKKENVIAYNNQPIANITNGCPALSKIKVAVLLSPYTASAAEQTAIGLEGRKNTLFIGESTRGMTTGVETIRISRNLVLDLASGYSVDRNGKAYPNGVKPDIQVEGGDNFKNLQKDKKVRAAIKWLKGRK